jgi:membrane-bound lytic murein transglycosylase D
MTHPTRAWSLAAAIAVATLALGGCEPPEQTRPSTSANGGPVSEPIPLQSAPPVEISNLPEEISAPITGPSRAPLPNERDVMTSGEVLDRLRARLSTPTCIVGPNNTRWRHKYAGYPQHFADEIQATLPMMLVVLDELERRKMPGEFALIPIVESWYRPETYSFGGAAGMWQMLNETSRNNGATVVSGYDGRLSTLDSTDAALTYLGKLNGMFNDWRLTAMAYNSGEYRLMRTMSPEELQQRSAGGMHYRRPDGLAGGTYEYVSKMRALTCLLAQPARQGIPLVSSVPVTHWVPFELPENVDSLDELASRLGTDAEELKEFNLGFRNGRVVADAPRTVLVPASTRPRWASAGGSPATLQLPQQAAPTATQVSPYGVAPSHPAPSHPAPYPPAPYQPAPYQSDPYHPRVDTQVAPVQVTTAPIATQPGPAVAIHAGAQPGFKTSAPAATAAKSSSPAAATPTHVPVATAQQPTFKPPTVTSTSSPIQSAPVATPSVPLPTALATTAKTTATATPPATSKTTVMSVPVDASKTSVVAIPSATPKPAVVVAPPLAAKATVVAPPSATPKSAVMAALSGVQNANVVAAPSGAPKAVIVVAPATVPKAILATTPMATSTAVTTATATGSSASSQTVGVAAPGTSPSPGSATVPVQASAPAGAAKSTVSPPPVVAARPATVAEPAVIPKSETGVAPIAATAAKTDRAAAVIMPSAEPAATVIPHASVPVHVPHVASPAAAEPAPGTPPPATSPDATATVGPPAPGTPSTPLQTPAPAPAQHYGYQYGIHTHIVGEDETLAGIAQRYGLSVEQLQAWNHLDPDERVKTGQQIKLEP